MSLPKNLAILHSPFLVFNHKLNTSFNGARGCPPVVTGFPAPSPAHGGSFNGAGGCPPVVTPCFPIYSLSGFQGPFPRTAFLFSSEEHFLAPNLRESLRRLCRGFSGIFPSASGSRRLHSPSSGRGTKSPSPKWQRDPRAKYPWTGVSNSRRNPCPLRGRVSFLDLLKAHHGVFAVLPLDSARGEMLEGLGRPWASISLRSSPSIHSP